MNWSCGDVDYSVVTVNEFAKILLAPFRNHSTATGKLRYLLDEFEYLFHPGKRGRRVITGYVIDYFLEIGNGRRRPDYSPDHLALIRRTTSS